MKTVVQLLWYLASFDLGYQKGQEEIYLHVDVWSLDSG